ncbi:hypothetical protein F444_17707 [Phytophthora nicotianae P1976]|uniref:Uncharacterized protein n=1 Tax=Phytophthora nicotianae P1976 TaxID=1317066 RepID=A0A080ZE19_PHYNI|nr:hypothetical protein F444_17707 [Phytophthora nicotianae P1976]
MTVSRPNLKSIKEMFLTETSYESSSDFSLEEYELLRQVSRRQQHKRFLSSPQAELFDYREKTEADGRFRRYKCISIRKS